MDDYIPQVGDIVELNFSSSCVSGYGEVEHCRPGDIAIFVVVRKTTLEERTNYDGTEAKWVSEFIVPRTKCRLVLKGFPCVKQKFIRGLANSLYEGDVDVASYETIR